MVYSGHKFLNFNTIVTLFLFLPFVIIMSLSDNIIGLMYFLIPILYMLFISEAFYFEITDEFLIIKNIGLPFYKIKYELKYIESIRIFNSGYRTFSIAKLQVKLDIKDSIGFKGASLRKKDWQLLIQDLENREIDIILDVII